MTSHDGTWPGSTFTIDPQHLSVTQTLIDDTTENLHILENHDLHVGAQAAAIIKSAEGGALLVALNVDDDHDEVHYTCDPSEPAADRLTRAIHTLTLARAALQTAIGA